MANENMNHWEMVQGVVTRRHWNNARRVIAWWMRTQHHLPVFNYSFVSLATQSIFTVFNWQHTQISCVCLKRGGTHTRERSCVSVTPKIPARRGAFAYLLKLIFFLLACVQFCWTVSVSCNFVLTLMLDASDKKRERSMKYRFFFPR